MHDAPEIVIPEDLEAATAEQVLAWSLATFEPRIALVTSFAAEGVVLIDLLTRLTRPVRVFTLDTGRLTPESYAVMEAIRERYDLEIRVLFPRTEAVEAMTREEGVNLFYRSVEARKRC
jgi:phosphoadenosine phosphosulfate reductase